jgi:hypothetical protein
MRICIKGRDASYGKKFLLPCVASNAEKFCYRPLNNLHQMKKNCIVQNRKTLLQPFYEIESKGEKICSKPSIL